MASGTSDLLPLLSTTIPLAASAILVTDKLIAGQYSSLSISVFSDTSTNVTIQFSGDGVNFDVSVIKSFIADMGGTESTVILSKWMRILVENTDVINQTILRVHTYANIQNTSLNASLVKINNIAPSVNVDNLPLTENVTLTEAPVTVFSSDMYHFTTVSPITQLIDTTLRRPMGGSTYRISKIEGAEGNNNPSLTRSTPDNWLKLSIGSTSDSEMRVSIISSRITSHHNGGKIISTFAAIWDSVNFTIGVNRQRLVIGVASGVGDCNSGANRNSFAVFGSYTEQVVSVVNEMQLAYSNGDVIDNMIVVSQPNFNVDKADGTLNLPIMSLESGIIGGRIIIEHSGAGFITWQIQHPTNGNFVTIHRHANNRQRSLFIDKGFSAVIYVQRLGTVEVANKFIEVSYLDIKQTANGITNVPMRITSYKHSISNIPIGTTDILAVRNLDFNELFTGIPNRMSCYISRIIFKSVIDANNPQNAHELIVRIYSVALNQLVHPAGWTPFALDQTPMLHQTNPVVTPGPPRILIHDETINWIREDGPKETPFIILDTTKMAGQGSSVNSEDWIFPPGHVLVFETETTIADWNLWITIDVVTGN